MESDSSKGTGTDTCGCNNRRNGRADGLAVDTGSVIEGVGVREALAVSDGVGEHVIEALPLDEGVRLRDCDGTCDAEGDATCDDVADAV